MRHNIDIIRWRLNKKLLHRHLIYTCPESAKSFSSLLLLNRYYRSLQVPERHLDWHPLFIVKRTFLRHHKNEKGTWTCHYCRKELTQLPKRNTNKQNLKKIVTIDHVDPASKCDDVLDSKNFVCACHRCNQDKGDMSYEEFTSTRFTKPKFSVGRINDLKTLYV